MMMYRLAPHTNRTAAAPRPAVNIRRENERIELQFVVPGLRREDLHIRIEDDHLVVTGTPDHQPTADFVRREFQPTAFEQRYKLGQKVDQSHIDAKVENGILTVTLGLVEPIRREIAVA